MTLDRQTATELLVLKAIGQRLRDAENIRKAEAVKAVGDRAHGVLPDGTDIGYVTVAKGRVTARVADEKALLEWVKATRPDEVLTTESVRSSFLAHLLDKAKKDGGLFDPETGEQLGFIELGVGDPYATVKLADGAAEAIAAAWQAGRLELPGGSDA